MKEIIKKAEDGKLLLEISTQIYEKEAITATSYNVHLQQPMDTEGYFLVCSF